MTKQVFILPAGRDSAVEAVRTAQGGMVTIGDVTRSGEQNAAQWPYLQGFSEQLQWPVNGALVWMTREEWKDVLTAVFENDTSPRLAAGFDGGVVMLGRRTSEYGKKKFSEWYEWLQAAAALKGVEPVYKTPDRNVRIIQDDAA